jgi:hypothetical protein
MDSLLRNSLTLSPMRREADTAVPAVAAAA